MFTLKNYKPGFDLGGLLLFLVIMLPNFLWFALPAPNDVLRVSSVTPTADRVGQVFQVLMVAALCVLRNTSRKQPMPNLYKAAVVLAVLFYFSGWLLYYAGVTSAAVILLLCLAPCMAFLLFSLARKNAAALLAASLFLLCHLTYGVMNFIR
ncbi:MAG: hypothetical protein ACI3VS_06510 [Evtepia sp.]